MVRHKREAKNYVIKKVKTRDMNPKDLENTENEVIIFTNYNSILKQKYYSYRCVFFRKSVIQTSLPTKTHLSTVSLT